MASKTSKTAKPAADKPQAPQPAGAVAETLKGGAALIQVGGDTPDHVKANTARGSENVTTGDLVIPRLEIVQAMSAQLKRGDAKFNELARAGMLYNTVTGRLYGENTFIVPVFYNKAWLVWKKRKDSQGKALEGGFLGAFNTPEEAQDKFDAEVKAGLNKDHAEVIDTPQHLCLLVDAGAGGSGDVSEVMLSMPRTKAKVSRNFNSMIRLAGGDRFSRVYRVGTVLEKNPKGDYYNFNIVQTGFPVKSLFDRAEKLYNAVTQGGRTFKADHSDLDDETIPPAGDGNTEM